MESFADIPRIYTALAEWGACMVYILMMKRRYKGLRFAAIAASALVIQALFMVLTGEVNIILWIPCMAAAVVLMYLFIYVCGTGSKTNAGFFCVKAFVLAEFAAAAEWHIYSFFWPENDAPVWISSLFLVITFGIIFLVAYAEKRYHADQPVFHINMRELMAAVIIGLAVFVISNLSFISSNTPFSGRYGFEIRLMRMLIDLGGVTMLLAQSVQIRDIRTKHELAAMQSTLDNQYNQYQHTKESIEVINQKFHDFKHQVGLLRIMDSEEKRNGYLDEIEHGIDISELNYKTGNHVLDTILAGKTMYCQRNKIKLTCVADGKLLSFMQTVDICSIIGNALDNAIEYVEQITEEKKRLIHLIVSAQKDFVLVKVENYFEGELELEDGLPKTHKKDKRNHGYGMKSMKLVAEKYNGTMTISVQEQWFEVKVLIPLPNE